MGLNCSHSAKESSADNAALWCFICSSRKSRHRILFQLSRNQSKGFRVYAIAKVRRLRTIIKYVPQMGVAFSTGNRRPHHAQAQVSCSLNILWCYGRPEAWPACSGIKFSTRAEQSIIAADAAIEPSLMQIPEFTCECDFGISLTGDSESSSG